MHAILQMTMDLYVHVTDNFLQDEMKNIVRQIIYAFIIVSGILMAGKHAGEYLSTDVQPVETADLTADSDRGAGTDSTQSASYISSDYEDLAYSGDPYAVINNNIPYFTENEITSEAYESYSELDSLGRCGAAMACVGLEIMPDEERGSIGSVKPTGWHTVKYAGIDGNYLYNRCHLIAYCLSGENANEKNLITGTRYLNIEGMLPFEMQVLDYVRNTGNHVMYRATPVFEGDNLVADGVLLEAYFVEDGGIL